MGVITGHRSDTYYRSELRWANYILAACCSMLSIFDTAGSCVPGSRWKWPQCPRLERGKLEKRGHNNMVLMGNRNCSFCVIRTLLKPFVSRRVTVQLHLVPSYIGGVVSFSREKPRSLAAPLCRNPTLRWVENCRGTSQVWCVLPMTLEIRGKRDGPVADFEALAIGHCKEHHSAATNLSTSPGEPDNPLHGTMVSLDVTPVMPLRCHHSPFFAQPTATLRAHICTTSDDYLTD